MKDPFSQFHLPETNQPPASVVEVALIKSHVTLLHWRSNDASFNLARASAGTDTAGRYTQDTQMDADYAERVCQVCYETISIKLHLNR